MATEDAWGLTPMPTDPPPFDGELGITTSDDTDWGPADIRLRPAAQHAVTRAQFTYEILAATYGTIRWIVCKTGVHRRKGWRT